MESDAGVKLEVKRVLEPDGGQKDHTRVEDRDVSEYSFSRSILLFLIQRFLDND